MKTFFLIIVPSIDLEFNFSINNDTEVFHSCSITWYNELYVYGGDSKKTQISKVTDCRLEQVGELEFEHKQGDCVNVADEQIYLCFDQNNGWKKCRVRTAPLGQFNEITSSHYDHRATRIATDDSELKSFLSDINFRRHNRGWFILPF